MGPRQMVEHLLQTTEVPVPLRPQVQLAGKDDAGQFRTAAAKEYPEGLAFSLAVTMLYSLRRRIGFEGCVERCTVFAAEEVAWLEGMAREAEFFSRATFLPDYQGGA